MLQIFRYYATDFAVLYFSSPFNKSFLYFSSPFKGAANPGVARARGPISLGILRYFPSNFTVFP